MKATKLAEKFPQFEWLLNAKISNEDVDEKDGLLVWIGGTWKDGTWKDGTWKGGTWKGGTWKGGTWEDGTWKGGTWKGGTWKGGTWKDGTWKDGTWKDGTWKGGTWKGGKWKGGTWEWGLWEGKENRLLYMVSLMGIMLDEDGCFVAFRTTNEDGSGRYNVKFIQPEGDYEESDLPPAGSGTCVKGIHVTSAARAWTYFGVDETCQFWRVRFRPDQLLDCDGEKARISGGTFTKIKRPF